MHFIAMLIVGAIIGALARLFMKGNQNIGMIWTIILGALGYAISGWIVGRIIGGGHTIIEWIVGVIVAIVLISLYLGITNKK